MEIERLRNYGVAFSDAEAAWPPALKKKMRKRGQALVFGSLGVMQGLRFAWHFFKAKRRAKTLDLQDLRAKGMNNAAFLAQQIEYLCVFSALLPLLGKEGAIRLLKRVMDETAREALLLCLPEAGEVQRAGEPFEVFRAYLRAVPGASCKAGCFDAAIVEDSAQAFQFNVNWCVWLELARKMGVPEACLPNCYADELVFPDYFKALGIEYKRSGTLAEGKNCCDFRFEKRNPPG